jgi:hypothetical protein
VSRSIRLTLLLHRFEVAAVLAGALVLLAAGIGAAMYLASLQVPLPCFGQPDVHGATGSADPVCRTVIRQFSSFNDQVVERIFLVLSGFPLLAGVVLGVPAVGRELEGGTAALPWVLSGQRRRWLVRRLAILSGVLLLALVPLAFAGDFLEGVRNPLAAQANSFGAEGLRGGVLVARGLAGLAVGCLAGLILGRQLPAVMVASVLGALLVIGGLVAMRSWAETIGSYVPSDEARLGDWPLTAGWRAHDGTVYSTSQLDELQPQSSLPPGAVDDAWIAANFDEVLKIVPGSRYGEEGFTHSALLLGFAGLLVLASLVLIDRRRVS